MADTDEKLTPATADEIIASLSFALRYDGRRRVYKADEMMGRIVAEKLLQHLEFCRFVVMKRPPIPAHEAPAEWSKKRP